MGIDISMDIWCEILNDLDMFDTIKLSHVSPELYAICNGNDIWKRHYNLLFDRRIITEKAIHRGPVTWFNCRCGPYPGWAKIHNHIDNTNMVCRKIDHYEELDTKMLKKTYKNFKHQTKKRYIQILRNDPLVTNIHNITYEKSRAMRDIALLQLKVSRLDKHISDSQVATQIINS